MAINTGKQEYDNIKKMQNLISENLISGYMGNLKKARIKLDQIYSAIKQKEINLQQQAAVKKEPAPIKTDVKAAPVVQVVKKQEPVVGRQERQTMVNQKPQFSQTRSQNTQFKQFPENRNQNGFNGGFRKDFSNGNRMGNRPQNGNFRPQFGANGQRPTFGNRPQFGQNGASVNANGNAFKKPAFNKPLISRPTESIESLNVHNKFANSASRKTVKHGGEEKKQMNKKALLMRGYVEDETLVDESYVGSGSWKKSKKVKEDTKKVVAPAIDHAVITTENLTVKILAEKIGKPVAQILSKLMELGMMMNINSNIDYDAAELVASEFGVTLERKIEEKAEDVLAGIHTEVDDEKDLVKRPPVVVVMGHVDHGKTSLLDYIRNTKVTSTEAGGITQHIGAYMIKVNGEPITFIDTPGHAAFTAMRARGAKLTDVAILVVAADDGVMPQTIEAIKFIKEAKVPMIVAINKIDKDTANVEKIKQQLADQEVLPEEWGGDAIMIPISAKTGQNIDKLLEMVLFVADYQNLRANPKRAAYGSIIEARLDKGKGSVATVLVQNGTLKTGDNVVVGNCSGKIRAMTNDKGENVKKAEPSTPVAILGLDGVPSAGDELYVVNEKLSQKVLAERHNKERSNMIKSADLSLDALMSKMEDSNFKDYNIIIKGDVQGSIEALTNSLSVLQNEEVKVRVIHTGVGAITENDVMLADAGHACIIGFNVKPDSKAKTYAEKNKVEIKFFRVIYEAIDFVNEQINNMLAPKFKEVVYGKAEIRAIFKASKFGAIAGTYVLDGKIVKGSKVRIYRKNKIIYDGTMPTLQRDKNEAKEVSSGFECGVTFDKFTDFEVGDTFESYGLEKI